jgi:fatty acid desaturase
MSVGAGMSDLDRRERRARNRFIALFVALAVVALVVLVCGVLSFIYPDSGIPFFWMAFPIGPQPVPIL